MENQVNDKYVLIECDFVYQKIPIVILEFHWTLKTVPKRRPS